MTFAPALRRRLKLTDGGRSHSRAIYRGWASAQCGLISHARRVRLPDPQLTDTAIYKEFEMLEIFIALMPYIAPILADCLDKEDRQPLVDFAKDFTKTAFRAGDPWAFAAGYSIGCFAKMPEAKFRKNCERILAAGEECEVLAAALKARKPAPVDEDSPIVTPQ